MLWIDAICQQALSARIISEMYALLGDTDGASEWNAKFGKKRDIVNSLYWNADDGFYYDIDRNTHEHYRIITTASFWALTAGVASDEQARALAKYVEDPKTLGGDVPLLSLSRSDNDFDPAGLYWRGGLWMPTAYASLCGLNRYGLYGTAHEAGCKILEHMYRTYVEYEPHTIWECYSPTKHEPASNEFGNHIARPDFCGWSALGPISIYIECVLGFHTVDGFDKVVEWERPDDLGARVGIKNLRFGDIVTDIIADGNECRVNASDAYTLKINGNAYPIAKGENCFQI